LLIPPSPRTESPHAVIKYHADTFNHNCLDPFPWPKCLWIIFTGTNLNIRLPDNLVVQGGPLDDLHVVACGEERMLERMGGHCPEFIAVTLEIEENIIEHSS
jgi:hypothetical protein